jgi:hypothetical protein
MLLTLAALTVLSGTAFAQRNSVKPDASIAVRVESVTRATADVGKAAAALGAKNVSRNVDRSGSYNSSTIVYSLPVSKADSLLSTARGLGEVTSESVSFGSKDDDAKVRVQITLTDEEQTYVARGKRSAFLAGASGLSSRVSGLTQKELDYTGWGITVAVTRRSAQLSIYSLKLDKDAFAEKQTDPDLEKERLQLEKENSGSMALVSHSTYSSFFGNGNRSFLNPFAGIAYGYSHIAGSSLAAIGGHVGVDLLNIGGIVMGTSAHMLGLYNSRDGATSSMFDLHLFIPF